MKSIHTFLITLAILPAAARTHAKETNRPNIILILTDDQGYGDLGCYGSKTIKTPWIDQMAKEGARLTTFYAAAPICTPTRAALMTGCHAIRVGLPTPLHVYDHIGLSPTEVTLPELLQSHGYKTGCIGKWHLGHLPPFYPTRHGFDHYYGTPLGHMFNRPAVGRNANDASDLFLANEKKIPFPPVQTITQRLTEKAVAFITANRNHPFFLYVAHTMPHEPLAVAPRFKGKSKAGLYGDVIEEIDWSTGQILQAVKKHNLDKKTLIIFTSDNGPKKGHGTTGPLRGHKHQPYEGGIRVPCIAWAPGQVPSGKVIGAMATIMDLYPTFAALVGARLPKDQVLDGRDISSLLLGKKGSKSPHSRFFYFVRHGALAGVREGKWKLLMQKGRPELYDLEKDIGEANNIAKQHPKIVVRLQAQMAAISKEIQRNKRQPGKPQKGTGS